MKVLPSVSAKTVCLPTTTLTAQDHFFDRLESYFDFRFSTPPADPSMVANLARQLVQACGMVQHSADRVDDEVHRRMIAWVVENDAVIAKWTLQGCKLGHAALILLPPLQAFLTGKAA